MKIEMVKLDGIDYSSLVYKDLYQTNSYRLAIEGLINYRFIKRLKQNKVKIHRIIDWWESQAMDKGLHKALSDFLPEVPAIGYLGYVPRKLELQLYPTKYELDCGVVPKNIKVIEFTRTSIRPCDVDALRPRRRCSQSNGVRLPTRYPAIPRR